MRAVFEVFKNELKKSYAENERLQRNIQDLYFSLKNNLRGYPAYHIAHNTLNACYATSKSFDALAKTLLRPISTKIMHITTPFFEDISLPPAFYKKGLFWNTNNLIHKIEIPQYYGGIKIFGPLRVQEIQKLKPQMNSGKRSSGSIKSIWDSITAKMDQERYISKIENQVIPYVLYNIYEKDPLKGIACEDVLPVLENFKYLLRNSVKNDDAFLLKARCIDIRNLESKVLKSMGKLVVHSKMYARFKITYYDRKGHMVSKFANYDFLLKFSHFFDSQEAPELLEIHFEPMKY